MTYYKKFGEGAEGGMDFMAVLMKHMTFIEQRKYLFLSICTWIVSNRNKRTNNLKRVDIQALDYKVVNIETPSALISLEKYILWW